MTIHRDSPSWLPALAPTQRTVLVIAAVSLLAGGAIHLVDWLNTYRHLPAEFPGSVVVRVGFPLNAAASLLAAGAIAACMIHPIARNTSVVILAAVGFQVSSLALLIMTRTGTVFGWSEMAWTSGANRTRAAEIAALVALVVAGGLLAVQRVTARSVTVSA